MGNALIKVAAAPVLSLRQLVTGHIHFLKQSLNPIFEATTSETADILMKKKRGKDDEKFLQPSSQSSPVSGRFYASVRLHAGFAILLQLFTALYGVFGHISVGSIGSIKELAESDRLYTHQMLPRVAWPQMDAGLAMDVTVSLVILTILSFRGEEERAKKYRVVYQKCTSITTTIIDQKKEILINGKKLTAAESTSIVKSYLQVKYLLVPGMTVFGVFCCLGLSTHAYLYLGAASFFRPLTLLFWTVAFPGQIFYCFYTNFGPICYVFLVSVVIQVQQRTLIGRLSSLNDKALVVVNAYQQQQHRKQQQQQQQQNLLISKFTRINRQYLALCTFTADYCRHCKPLLSTLIPYLIGVQCYMLYMILFQADSLSPTLTVLFLLTTIEVQLFLLALVEQCAKVSTLNGAFERLNKRFYLMVVFGSAGGGGGDELKGVCLMKIQSMQLHKRLRVFAFQLAGDYVITRKTFPTVLMYIVTAFLFVVKSNAANKNGH